MAVRGQLYIPLIGGQSLNVQDVINNNSDKPLERINIVCDTTGGGPINIALPAIANLSGYTNLEIMVSDDRGNASVTNIIVTRAGTDKINGVTSKTLNTNFEKAFFQVASIGSSVLPAMAAGWTYFTTAVSTPYTPPTEVNEVGVISAGNDLQLTNFPLLASKHLILSIEGFTKTPIAPVDYTVNYATGLITFNTGLPGDVVSVFYSY